MFTILTSIKIISNSCLFAILNVTICMMFRQLTDNTHKLAHRNWSARSMGRVIDFLHTACIDLIYDRILIHDKSFMMHIYELLMDELHEFKYYMDYQCKDRTSHYSVSSKTSQVPLNKLIKELFTLTYRDNQYRTNFLERLTVIGIQALLDEVEYYKKATYKYLSISISELSWEN